MTEAWRTSSYSGNQGNCVSVHRNLQRVRDSKNPTGPELALSPTALFFLAQLAKTGRFDR
jgi:hypothetical protein